MTTPVNASFEPSRGDAVRADDLARTGALPTFEAVCVNDCPASDRFLEDLDTPPSQPFGSDLNGLPMSSREKPWTFIAASFISMTTQSRSTLMIASLTLLKIASRLERYLSCSSLKALYRRADPVARSSACSVTGW